MKNVDNGHRRHKCSICGRVRFEKNMEKIYGWRGTVRKTRFGNICWACADNQNCHEEAIYFYPY